MDKRIVVTGGSGKAGRAVVAEMLAHGYDVTVVDQVVPPGRPCPSIVADLTDYGQAVDAIGGEGEPPHAVVHLAAVPAPRLRANAATFANNVPTDYNVSEACRHLGVRHVVYASSETVLGLPFDRPPAYVPVDEDAPPRPESAYSLGKLLSETMATQFCRWDPRLKMVGLRFSNVMDPADYAAFPGYDADPTLRKWNLWGYIDARDAARAVRLAVEWDGTGAEVFVIANADTVMSRPNNVLLDDVFPGVERRRPVGDRDTLLSIDKARRVLGYEPRHPWRSSLLGVVHHAVDATAAW